MEKKNSSKPARKATLTPNQKKRISPLLSPLEATVLYGKPDPFLYNIDGVDIYISRWLGVELMKCAKRKLDLFKATRERDTLAINIPFKLRETFDDPKIILSLHTRLRNRLCRLECYSLFAIMLKGRKYFEDEHKFSKQNMKTLDALFVKYKCGDLF